LTRYADDIVYSTNKKNACRLFYRKIKTLLGKTKSPHLIINTTKTLFLSRGTLRRVTGLTITPDGTISIGRMNKRYIRKLINDFRFKKLDAEGTKYVRGYLAYILDVEPRYYNSLAMKYGAETLARIANG